LAYHQGSDSLYTGSYDSVVTRWNHSTGANDRVSGGHSNSITSVRVQGDDLHSISMDDTYRSTKHGQNYTGAATSLGSKPLALGVSRNAAGVALTGTFDQQVQLIRNGAVVATKSVTFNPQSAAVNAAGTVGAIGGDDNKIHLFNISGNNLTEGPLVEGHRYAVTAIAFSPDGKYIVSGDKNNTIILWNAVDHKMIHNNKFVYHSARINALEFSPDSKFVASCSLDTSVIIWNVADPDKRVHIKAAHHGAVNDVCWIDNNSVASVGADASLRTWNVVWS